MAQYVTSKKIKTLGWNSSVGAGFIEFASGDVGGSPPSGGSANTFGFSSANADDMRAWDFAVKAQIQGFPVSCEGTNTLLGSVVWERMKQINYAAPQ